MHLYCLTLRRKPFKLPVARQLLVQLTANPARASDATRPSLSTSTSSTRNHIPPENPILRHRVVDIIAAAEFTLYYS